MSDIFGDILGLRDMEEDLFLDGIDDGDRGQFGEKLWRVGSLAVNLRSSLCRSG